MSPDKVVPTAVTLAAKRGFVRTTAQAYAASLSAGFPSAAALVAFIEDDNPAKWWLVAATVGLALITPPLSGLASYLNIVSKGIPQDYADATVQVVDPSGNDHTVPVDGRGWPVTR